MWPFSVVSLWRRGQWGPSCQRKDWYTGEVWVCVPSFSTSSCVAVVDNLLIIVCMSHRYPGCLYRDRKDQVIGELGSNTEKPPTPPPDLSQPEIEDDSQDVSMVNHLLVKTLPHKQVRLTATTVSAGMDERHVFFLQLLCSRAFWLTNMKMALV